MEALDLDKNVLEFGGGDMGDIWGPSEVLDTGLPEGDGQWHPSMNCSESVVLRDRMITEASLPIKTEHSYCSAEADQAMVIVKEEVDEMESECFPAISMWKASGVDDRDQKVTVLKPVLKRRSPVANRLIAQAQQGRQVLPGGAVHAAKVSTGQLRPQTIVLTATGPATPRRTADGTVIPRLSVKVEPSSAFSLPPTPPSSDSDGGTSPVHTGSLASPVRAAPQRSPKVLVTAGKPVCRQTIASPLISGHWKNGAYDTLCLTEEEKRTLVTEGYTVPSRLPLSKTEERSLKKIRRKIKNKISAQESRRKKKEYMDQLERRLVRIVAENDGYHARLAELEDEHRQLGNQHSQLETRNALLLRQLAQMQLALGRDAGSKELNERPVLIKTEQL
ncbi:uncharacterized protein LOC119092337 [Pollicipes pollicipes]|uniref:uncharacterized protein LOC119092337 n=1 Tax=Pollicipes pollicipes TaxID=41117 RepID=UPI001885799B|nr:uncharacterized protein LOC119092337 [Pollicipes pollicipes]